MDQPSTSSSSPGSSQQNKPNNNNDAIKDWTQEEKYHLLEALKTIDRHDIKKIQEYVITKTFEETKAAVDYYISIAMQHHATLSDPEERERNQPKQKRNKKPSVPLTEWANLLTDNYQYSDLKTEIVTAIRMIADLEKIPAKELTEGIDFRLFYHQLANAMEGKPMTADPGTLAVLHKCVVETALSSKAFINTAAKRNVLSNIDFTNKVMNINFPRPTENHELAILRHLASQRNYNPLNIPEEHLKPSSSADEKPFS